MGVYLGTNDINLFCGQPNISINNQNKTVTPSSSTQTITADAGHGYTGLGTVTVNAVPSGSASPAASISDTGATLSSGTNTLTLSKTVSNTPQVTAGYISSGTAGNSVISLTASVPTKASQTYNPTTDTDVTIPSGTYLTGDQIFKKMLWQQKTITSNGTYTADAGYTALGSVIVNVSGGSSKNVQVVQNSSTRITATAYTKACGTITVSKAGTYDIYWCAYRTSTSGTWGTQWYKNGEAQGTAQTAFTNSYYQAIHLTNITLAKDDTIDVYGRSRGSGYYLYVGQLLIIEV